MMALYFVSQWEQRTKQEFQLIEMGPGNGTLLQDIIRTFRQFPRIFKRLRHIHLLEISPAMKLQQREMLKRSGIISPDASTVSNVEVSSESDTFKDSKTGLSVHWHSSLESIPNEFPSFIIGHEFLDCLPIKQYQLTTEQNQWQEIHIQDKIQSSNDTDSLEMVLKPTQASALVSQVITNYLSEKNLAKNLLPGHIFETCPFALEIYRNTLPYVGKFGASLFIDYAYDRPPFKNTLRVSRYILSVVSILYFSVFFFVGNSKTRFCLAAL